MPSFLIIQTAFFGDVILATALIEQLALEFPGARIDMVVQKSREVLLKNNPHLNSVYTFDKKKKFNSLLELRKEFKNQNYDYAINVHRHGTSGLIARLSGAKEIIGFDAHPLAFLFHRKIKHQEKGCHETERNYQLIAHLTSKPLCRPKLYPSAADYKLVKQSNNYITISPASVWATKRYPAEKWAELIDHFSSDIDVILLGGPGDIDLCNEVAGLSVRPVTNKAGEYKFLPSAALMKHAVMNYTNDSAPVHMASAMNAPVTGLFLSTVPDFGYGPLSDQSIVMETTETLDCRPCGVHGYRKCPKGHFKCAQISANRVFQVSMKS